MVASAVVVGAGVHPEGIFFASRGVRSSLGGAEPDGGTFRLLKAGSFINIYNTEAELAEWF